MLNSRPVYQIGTADLPANRSADLQRCDVVGERNCRSRILIHTKRQSKLRGKHVSAVHGNSGRGFTRGKSRKAVDTPPTICNGDQGGTVLPESDYDLRKVLRIPRRNPLSQSSQFRVDSPIPPWQSDRTR